MKFINLSSYPFRNTSLEDYFYVPPFDVERLSEFSYDLYHLAFRIFQKET